MSKIENEQLIMQLSDILDTINEDAKEYGSDLNKVPPFVSHKYIAISRAAILRITGLNSPYCQQVNEILATKEHDAVKMVQILGVVSALRYDLAAGYMKTAEELIHGELFSDFLDMASYLLEEGYKDAAAVICGASLESHLKQLAKKCDINTYISAESGTRPKKADSLNSELARATSYSVLDQKNVTAWLDLRNKAAHGSYDSYTKDQVVLMIAGIRDFITRNTA